MVPAGLVVTGGLAVTRGLGLANFFRFFTMTFFFLMTRTRTRCGEVPGDQGEQHRGREEWHAIPGGEVCHPKKACVPPQVPPQASTELSMDLEACTV